MSSNLHPVGGTGTGAAATESVLNIVEETAASGSVTAGLQAITSSPGMVNLLIGWAKTKFIQPIRESKLFQSRACQITLLVLGILLVVAGLACMFIFHSQLGANAFWLIIPATIGLIKLLVTSLCFDEACTSEKLMVFQKWAGVLEDQLDDGILNNSNKIFGHVKTEGSNSRATTPVPTSEGRGTPILSPLVSKIARV
ncbi:sulfur-rich protein [Chlamydia pneumoniae LPCoLN]|uniref:cysteine-rich outer membrane protein n=1 Tax=Chlamydia pneumoniae TaxID=83558 RepID=UPI0001BD9E38|nr:cysteine-rich outer membrane protein [Chlamydia pneumoniae]ACZ33531.1 sulfur-rich protein [Chlamydia pneumoniae LPCoLN]ETR80453.1 15 kDa Cysteine-Rich Protein [Chlamydia pneumoniae B21]